VGITRARKRLYLTHAWSRSLFGGSNFNPPSRFLGEMPVHLVHALETERTRSSRAPAGPPAREPVSVSEGDTVFHDKWGEGVVLSVTGRGDRAEATIAFEDGEEKRVLLAYAPLAPR
jgi:DNA helicase-2/ATP-dependent DNA helicase PcrA